MALAAACGDDDPQVAAADDTSDGTATVEVALEPTESVFVEGFELTLRFETGDDTELETVDWSSFVQAADTTDIRAFYDSVLPQEVPAGTVRVVSTMEIGMSGGPMDPCTTELDLAPGETARVTIAFDGTCRAS